MMLMATNYHQWGELKMTQRALPFKYENQKSKAALTALGGLPLYLDLLHVMELPKSIDRYLRMRAEGRGWTDNEMLTSLILLNLAGGDCVRDLRVLENDAGLCRLICKIRQWGLSPKERCKLEHRWRKKRSQTFPSASSVFRYLSEFNDPTQETPRTEGKAFIPKPKECLQGFAKVNGDLSGFIRKQAPRATATLDMDATLVETAKSEALFCYKGYRVSAD